MSYLIVSRASNTEIGNKQTNKKKKIIDFFTSINKRVPKVHVLRNDGRAPLAQTSSRKARRKTRGEREGGVISLWQPTLNLNLFILLLDFSNSWKTWVGGVGYEVNSLNHGSRGSLLPFYFRFLYRRKGNGWKRKTTRWQISNPNRETYIEPEAGQTFAPT